MYVHMHAPPVGSGREGPNVTLTLNLNLTLTVQEVQELLDTSSSSIPDFERRTSSSSKPVDLLVDQVLNDPVVIAAAETSSSTPDIVDQVLDDPILDQVIAAAANARVRTYARTHGWVKLNPNLNPYPDP